MEKMCCACAFIKGSEKYPQIHGNVSFRQLSSGVLVTAEIFNLPQDKDIFAFHIHQGSKCSGTDGHFDSDKSLHPYHSGDLPPLFANNGYAYMSVVSGRFTISEIIGKTIIIHGGIDDFSSQPSGNSGEKIACGEIFNFIRKRKQYSDC